jgi:radical SAM superfamily enzyme YgiQ (UPF0313 family)
MIGDAFALIASIKKTGLTFAPEAATERLRRILNKDFNMEEFFGVIQKAYLCGYENIKLYFMMGLPFERDEDLDGIIDLSTKVMELRKRINKRPARLNVSVNTLIPKPHTCFQWLKMESIDSIKYKQGYIKGRIKNSRLKLSVRDPSMSFLEGVLSRGDRPLSRVIASAFSKWARFDAWDNHFMFDIWMDAFREEGINPDLYLQERSRNELLPWDFIDVGVSKESIIREADKLVDIA